MQRKAVPASPSEWKVLKTNKTLPTTTLIEHLLLGEDEVGPNPRPQEAKAEATADQLHNSADDHREVGFLQSAGNDGTNTYASEQAENGTSKEDVDDDADQTHGIVLNDGDMEEGVQTHSSDKEIVGGVFIINVRPQPTVSPVSANHFISDKADARHLSNRGLTTP